MAINRAEVAPSFTLRLPANKTYGYDEQLLKIDVPLAPAPATTVPSPTSPSEATQPTTPGTADTTGGLHARLQLPSSTLTGGATMQGQAIIANNTGQPINITTCGSPFQVLLANDQFQQTAGWTLCARNVTIATGESSWPISITTIRPTCTTSPNASPPSGLDCNPTQAGQPLPPGHYTATLISDGLDVTATTEIDIT